MEKRPLTQDEIKYLKGYFGSTPNDTYSTILRAICGYAFLVGLIFIPLNLVTKFIIAPAFEFAYLHDYKIYILTLSMIIALVILLSLELSFLKFKQKSNSQLENALKTNQAEIHNLSISRAAELEDYGDEDVGFFLETEDGRVLFVIGQDLYDYASDYKDEDKENSTGNNPYGQYFPSTNLTLIRESTIGIRLNLIAKGDKINNILKLKGKSFIKKDQGQNKYIGPEDGAFYDGKLEDVLEKFSISPSK